MAARSTTRKREKGTKIDRQIKKYLPLIIGLAVLIVIFIALYLFLQGLGKIEYQGLSFTREKIGEVLVYTYNYYIKNPEGKIIQNTLYVRNDPRKNNVPVEGEIFYSEGKTVYISVNGSGLEKCEDRMIAVATLSLFLKSNNFKVRGGTPDREEAIENNLTYVSCKNYPNNPVIAIKSANETKITRNDFCYTIEVANCEIQQAAEKLIVQSIIDAKKAAQPVIKVA